MPAYRAELTLAKTFRAIPIGLADAVLVVDDASPDRTVAVARELGLPVTVHPANRGYGGNQKTCYDLALADGADVIVLLHPDYQYDPAALPGLIAPLLAGRADFTFGSRFCKAGGSDPLAGGMPLYRYIGNRLTTALENLVLGTHYTELHSGLKAYSRRFLEELDYHAYNDRFVFDSQMLIEALLLGYRVEEVAIPTRYTAESSSVNLKSSLVYIARTVTTLFRYKLAARRLRKRHAERLARL